MNVGMEGSVAMDQLHGNESVGASGLSSSNLERSELLSIFPDDKSVYDHDVLQMNSLFSRCMHALNLQLACRPCGDEIAVPTDLIGQIATVLSGFQKLHGATMLVADLDRLDPDIRKGIRDKEYHIGLSKKVKGNARAVVVDSKEQIKAQITLKEVQKDPALLSDISMLSIQSALRHISIQLEDIARDVSYMIAFSRRQELQKPFLDARSKVIEAARSTEPQESNACINNALESLMRGLNSLYADLEANVKNLAALYDKPMAKIQDIDVLLQYISEDMNLIPKYVALRAYLLGFVGKAPQVNDVIVEFRYKASWLASERLGQKQLTAAQLIHKFYPYNEQTRDLWLTAVPAISKQLQALEVHELTESKKAYRLEITEVADE